MTKSDQLIKELFDSQLAVFTDKQRAKEIILEYFSRIHEEAVNATIIATNKIKFQLPKYND